MKRFIAATASLLLGILGWSVPGLAQTVTFQQGTAGYTGTMDTYIDQFMPTDTFGGVQWIEIRHYDPGTLSEKQNLLLRFDLSTIPTNATVTSATLKLWNIRANMNDAADSIILGKVTGAWNNQSTWSMGVPTTTPSGVTCPSIVSYTMSPAAPELYTIPGMASLVQGWVTTPGSNLGLMMSITTNLNLRFASSEYSTIQYRPRLEVTYTTAGPPPTLTVTPPPPATTGVSPLNVTGTATPSSPATITSVTWSNAEAGTNGTATGTTSWTASIPLVRGANTITVTATDSTGATGTATFAVNYAPPRPPGYGGNGHKPCGSGAAVPDDGESILVALGVVALLLGASTRNLPRQIRP